MGGAQETNSESNEEVSDSFADQTRRRYLYRKMAINGHRKIPARLAMKMAGPDCAFHLYRHLNPESDSAE